MLLMFFVKCNLSNDRPPRITGDCDLKALEGMNNFHVSHIKMLMSLDFVSLFHGLFF